MGGVTFWGPLTRNRGPARRRLHPPAWCGPPWAPSSPPRAGSGLWPRPRSHPGSMLARLRFLSPADEKHLLILWKRPGPIFGRPAQPGSRSRKTFGLYCSFFILIRNLDLPGVLPVLFLSFFFSCVVFESGVFHPDNIALFAPRSPAQTRSQPTGQGSRVETCAAACPCARLSQTPGWALPIIPRHINP